MRVEGERGEGKRREKGKRRPREGGGGNMGEIMGRKEKEERGGEKGETGEQKGETKGRWGKKREGERKEKGSEGERRGVDVRGGEEAKLSGLTHSL